MKTLLIFLLILAFCAIVFIPQDWQNFIKEKYTNFQLEQRHKILLEEQQKGTITILKPW